MLYSVIKPGLFQDSVSLMLLTRKLSDVAGVERVSVMMGTPANKEIFGNTGMLTAEIEKAVPSDLCVALEARSAEVIDLVMQGVDAFLANQSVARKGVAYSRAHGLHGALAQQPQSNLALISVAGRYAAREAYKALDSGLNVFMFSDNVEADVERELKIYAHQKGLLVMGPDCGTAVIGGVPLAFANKVLSGAIGIVGASGTGIQAVLAAVDAQGEGISHAIGIGGRDLSSTVGGRSALDAISLLVNDPATEVIVFISKPPAREVREHIELALRVQPKPAIALFLGERVEAPQTGELQLAETLDQAASLAVEQLRRVRRREAMARMRPGQRNISGLFCGGTLAAETALLLAHQLGLPPSSHHEDGVMFSALGHRVIDLGDDAYTVGRAHPMIDPSLRSEMLIESSVVPETAVVLFDVVIGYGAHADPAGLVVEAIESGRRQRGRQNGEIAYIAYLCGTRHDPQGWEAQYRKLRDAGIWVCTSSREAAQLALELSSEARPAPTPCRQQQTPALLAAAPRVINIGLQSFADDLARCGASVVQVDWAPPAGGNARLIAALDALQ
ncbi:acyl-CoA synthetase FdrA [Pseudomonas nitroreducens]|uniref:acyl-CoA synthetase FdrA n=1 Tax=Pseudomonas nitroreducens TaxID=46680 RepID=UPI00209EAE5A|nr:acyl-CoA synthetase FdrA [Pseudomonas nitroreducens]MCP1621875.1 FdrA protein [Pseudomonas nitroreducens]